MTFLANVISNTKLHIVFYTQINRYFVDDILYNK